MDEAPTLPCPEIAPLRRRVAAFLDVEPAQVGLCHDLDGIKGAAAEHEAVVIVEPDRELSSDPSARRSIGEIVDQCREAGLHVAWFGHGRDEPTGYHRSTAVVLVGPKSLDAFTFTGIEGFSVAGSDFTPATGEGSPKKVAIVTSELHGPMHNGGIGTSYTALAEALVEDGQTVTVVYVGEHLSEEPMEHWVEHYAAKGIRVVPIGVEKSSAIRWQYEWPRRSWLAMRWLREQDADPATRLDVIHFPECNGHGFHTVAARKAGLAFDDTVLCTGAHSSTRWIYEAAGNPFFSMSQVALDFMEEQCLTGSDVVVSPSAYLIQWMRNTGWELPAATYAQQNVQPQTARGGVDEPLDDPLPDAAPIRELVFFGRLETRKGIHTFCDALDLMGSAMNGVSVTFMGKITDLEGVASDVYLAERARKWDFDHQILSTLDQTGANAYLQGEGRLAVMPSPVDNSPNTVLECIGLKIPFLASQAGGIPELIDPRDIAVSTFHHPVFERRPEALADKLEAILTNGTRPARRAVSSSGNEAAWCAWHRQLQGPEPFREQSAPKALCETCESIGLLLLGDAKDPSVGFPVDSEAESEWLLVLDAAAAVDPDKLSQWLEAASNTGGDLVTGFHHGDPEASEPLDYPVGPAALLSTFVNCFGPGPFLIRSETLRKLGGVEALPTDLTDLRPFFLRALQQGTDFGFVPEPLGAYPFPVDERARSGEEPPLDEALVDVLLDDASPAVKFLLRFSGAKQERAESMMQDYYDMKYRVEEGYDKLQATFEDQTKWLVEREAVLAQTEDELDKARAESEKRATAATKAKEQLAKLKKERDQFKAASEKRKGLLARILGK